MNRIEVLIISNKRDFSTDYVAYALHELNVPYLRIDRDELLNYSIRFLPESEELHIELNGERFYTSSEILKSVYYRAPTFIRTLGTPTGPEEQIHKFQWASFIRNLIVFENSLWINHPVHTYQAENKLYQLKVARQCGFKIPRTEVSNDSAISNIRKDERYAIKTLDPGLLHIGDQEGFIYTNIVSGIELLRSDLRLSPVVIQELLDPKVDIRVTVVRDKAWAIKILKHGEGITGDWRTTKRDELEYVSVSLPEDVIRSCVNLVKGLKLIFGAIDLAIYNHEYYFLEINPTGEWGWLVNTVNFNIHEEIADSLSEGKGR